MSKIEEVAKIESKRKIGAMIFAAKVKAHSAEFQTVMPAIYKDFPKYASSLHFPLSV